MLNIKIVLGFVVLTLLLAACGYTRPVDVPGESDVALEAAASPYTEAWWYKGQAAKTLIPEWQGFCWLSGIQGPLTSVFDFATVYLSGGQWRIAGYGAVTWASATCVKWSALKWSITQMPPITVVKKMSDEVGGFFTESDCDEKSPYQLWNQNTSANFLTGFGGKLAHSASIWIDDDDGKPDLECISSIGNIFSWARSVLFGSDDPVWRARFWNLWENKPGYWDVVSSTWVTSSGSYPSETFNLAPTDQAFCYLTGIDGSFDNTKDWVYLWRGLDTSGKEVWKLTVNTKYIPFGGTGVSASSACYMLQQIN